MRTVDTGKRTGDANCRDCGALVQYKNHDCKPVDFGIIGTLEKIGRDAVKAEIAQMSDESLVKAVQVLCISGRSTPDLSLIAELGSRFRKITEDQA